MEESPRDLVHNGVKEKLARNELVLSMTVRLVRSIEIVSIAQSAGFDSFYVDLEHSSFSLETTAQLCVAGLSLGVTPFVRVPSLAPDCIARVLDGGALGVIAPHVQGADEAARLLAGSGWLPEVLRLPVDQIPAEAEVDAVLSDAVVEDDTTEAADIDLPAFLTENEEAAEAATDPIDGDGDGEHLEAAE